MRIIILSILLFFSALSTKAAPSENPKIFVLLGELSGDSAIRYATVYEKTIADKVRKEFPCAKVTTNSDVYAKLGKQKDLELHGKDSEWPNFCQDLATEYLVILQINYLLKDQLSAYAVCYYYHEKDPIIPVGRVEEHGKYSRDYAGIKSLIDKVSEKFVNELAMKNEICPYKGPASIQVRTEIKEEHKEEYDVYCSRMDRKYIKTTTLDKKSSAEWKLEKIKKTRATGTILYSMAEKTEVEEVNDCYKCDPLTSGRRVYSDVSVNFLEIEGISKDSKSEGENVHDALVQIEFLKDGNYTLFIKASSEKGDLKTLREEKASGDCDEFTKPQVNTTNKSDIGLREILGPFKGSGKDKVLHEKKTIEKVDPVTKEKTTISFDFNLSRE